MKSRIDKIAWALFWVLPLIYFVLYGPYGFSYTDPSFIPGLSHRVLLGEHAGLDFIYVRPPLTPYLHALELAILPQDSEVLWMRLVYFLMVAMSVYWGVRSLQRYLNMEEWGIRPGLLAVVGLIFTYHDYPAMPWHTVDGVFFTMAGVFVLTRRESIWSVAAGLLLMGLAALTKQPFALVPIMGVALAFLLHPFRVAWRGAAVAFGLGLSVLVGFMALESGRSFLAANLQYIAGSSSPGDLFQAGVKSYLPGVVFGTPYFLLFLAGRIFPKTSFRGAIIFAFVLGGMMAWLVFHPWSMHNLAVHHAPRYGFYHVQLLIAVCTAIWMYFSLDLRKGMGVLLFLSIAAWVSGISWGYAIPSLLALPGLFGTLIFATALHDFRLPKWALPFLAVFAFASFYIALEYPYQEKHRRELTYDLGSLYPELNHIHTHKEQFDKLADFKHMHARVEGGYAVLPGFPIADYLTHTKPAIQLDWEHDGEMAYDKGIQQVIGRLEERNVTVLVEKDMISEAYSPSRNYRCSVLAHVLENWVKTDSSEYFMVCRKVEPLPFIYFQF